MAPAVYPIRCGRLSCSILALHFPCHVASLKGIPVISPLPHFISYSRTVFRSWSSLTSPLLFSSLIMGRSVQAYRVISHSTVFEPRWLLDTKGQRHEPIRESYQRLLPVRSQARCSFSSCPFFISHQSCNLQHREILDGESNRIDGRWPFFQLSTTLLHADSRTEESRVEGLRTTRLRLSLFFSQSSIWGRFVLATYSWKQFSLTRNPW